MNSNSEKFLQVFNTIEKHLRWLTGSDRYTPFYQLVDRASAGDAAVRRMRTDLLEFADLRNAIVHERTDGHVIAEPNEISVQRFEKIKSLLTEPPGVGNYMVRNVRILPAEMAIGKAAELLYKSGFSQAPVYSGEIYLGLLTTDTIARWFADYLEAEIVDIATTRVDEVLEYTEDKEHVYFLDRSATVFHVFELLDKYQGLGKRLDAILVTHSGSSKEKLLGMLTIWDLPELYKAIEISRE